MSESSHIQRGAVAYARRPLKKMAYLRSGCPGVRFRISRSRVRVRVELLLSYHFGALKRLVNMVLGRGMGIFMCTETKEASVVCLRALVNALILYISSLCIRPFLGQENNVVRVSARSTFMWKWVIERTNEMQE